MAKGAFQVWLTAALGIREARACLGFCWDPGRGGEGRAAPEGPGVWSALLWPREWGHGGLCGGAGFSSCLPDARGLSSPL